MRQIFNIPCTSVVNRRDLPHLIEDGEVLSRENMEVVGSGKEKRNRKVPGANRFSDTDTGDYYISGIRYYSGANLRKTFAFNNGVIYQVDDNGVESAVPDLVFGLTAVPVWEIMKVSSNNVLFVSEGINTGMYSYDGNIGNNFVKETPVTLNLVGMLSHLDRMFGFEEDSEDLVFSKNLEPTNFTDSTDAGVITIGAKRGSKIQAIALLYGTLFIFKQDSIWALIGRSPSEFEVKEVTPRLGTSARRSVVNTDNGIIFLGSDFEFYFFSGTVGSLQMLSYKMAVGGDLTKNLIPIINRDKADQAVAVFHNKVYRCSVVENGETMNNLEYCFSTINETDWLTRGFNISCYIPWDRTPDKLELLFGRRDIGLLMLANQGLNVDNGATSPTMAFKLQTKFISSGEPRNIRFKRAFFTFGVLDSAEPLRVYYYLDCRTTRSDAGDDEWAIRGEFKVGIGNMSSQRAITSRVNLDYGKSRGQNISFMIDESKPNIDLELAGIDVECVIRPYSVKKGKPVNV